MAQEGKLTRVFELATDLLRWWGLIVAGFAFGLAGGVAAYHYLPKTYVSATMIMVVPSQIPLEFARSGAGEDMSLRLRSLRESVMSRDYLIKLIGQVFGPQASTENQERLIAQLRGRVQAIVRSRDDRTGAGLFEVRYRDSDPERAANVANLLAGFYVDENVRLRTDRARSTADTLKNLADDVAAQLAEKEKLIADFRAAHPYELPEHLSANLQLLSARQTELEARQQALVSAQDRLALLRTQRDTAQQLAAATSTPAAGDQVDPRLSRLAALERELATQRSRYTDEHPAVKATKRQIADLRQSLRDSPPPGMTGDQALSSSPLDFQIQEQEREIARLQSELAQIRADVQLYQSRVEATPRVEQQLAQLTKGYDALNQQYQSLRRDYEQARGSFRIEESRKGEQFEVVDKAVPPAFPSEPNKMQLYLMGIALGLGAMTGPLLLWRLLRPTVDSEAGLRAMAPEIPVLASFDRLPTRIVGRRAMWRLATNCALSAAGGAALGVAALRFVLR